MKTRLITSLVVIETFLIFISSMTLNNFVKLDKTNKAIIEQQQEINKQLIEDNLKIVDDMEAENQKLQDQFKELEEKYNDLTEKYNLEIAPVSYNENNLLGNSNVTVNKLKRALKGTGLAGLEQAYFDAEKEYGVNAIFLISLTAEESSWGTSRRARYQNNMSGFEVYSDSSKGATFSSKYESILTTARLLKKEYLTAGGKYYGGLDIYSVNKRYCPVNGYTWSRNISSIANSLVAKVNNR